MRPFASLILALEQRPAAFFLAPRIHRFLGGLVDDHLVFDPIDPAARNRMMGAACFRIVPRQDDAVVAYSIDRADLFPVRSTTSICAVTCRSDWRWVSRRPRQVPNSCSNFD